MIKKYFLQFLIILALSGATFAQDSTPIEIKKVEMPSELRLRYGFDYTQYYGVLKSQEDLNQIWKNLINIQDDTAELNRWLPWVKGSVPSCPEIDFEQYSVLWYADRGSNASFVSAIEAFEHTSRIVVKITAFYSDFGSRSLNLWKIPKTDKDVFFEEIREYETGGP